MRCPQSAKDAPSSITAWNAKKAETVELMKLLQTYKDLGDQKSEVRLTSYRGVGLMAGWMRLGVPENGLISPSWLPLPCPYTALPQVPQPEDL